VHCHDPALLNPNDNILAYAAIMKIVEEPKTAIDAFDAFLTRIEDENNEGI